MLEAIKLITNFGAEKGYSFTQDSVAQMFSRLSLEEQELSEADLLAVTGGLQPISGGLCKTINSGTRC